MIRFNLKVILMLIKIEKSIIRVKLQILGVNAFFPLQLMAAHEHCVERS